METVRRLSRSVSGAHVLVLAILLSAGAAEAHRPYAVRIKSLEGPQGQPLIIEKLFGDGIFSADPVSLQLRNSRGAVLAYTPVGQHVAVFCPSLKSCWAFPHDALFGLASSWRLDPSGLEYERPLDSDLEGKIESRGRITYGFGDPGRRSAASGFKKEASLWPRLASPLFVFLDHAILLTVLAFTCAFPFALRCAKKRLTASRQGAAKLAIAIFLGLLYALNALVLLLLIYLTFSLAAPWLYALATAGLSRWAGGRCLRSNQAENPAILAP